jgi:U3 small nucleolar RNA-associated protein 20
VARTSFLDSAASPAQVLGSALVAFSRIATASQGKESNITKSLQSSVLDMIERFSWHRGVMKGIAALQLTPAAVDSSTVTSRRIYDALLPNLFSEDSLLRLSSLQIAASILPASTNPVAADLIAKCIEVEEMPLSVQGAREKSMKLRKLGIVANGQLGREGEDSTMALGIILRYLTGKFILSFIFLHIETQMPLVNSDDESQFQASLAGSNWCSRPPIGTVPRSRLANLLATTAYRCHSRFRLIRVS